MNIHFENIDSIQKSLSMNNKNWVISFSNKLCFIIFLASLSAIIFRWSKLPPELPLWYAKPWGDERLASPNYLFLLPAGSLFWHLINTIFSVYITKDYLVFTQLLYIASFIVNLLSFITLVKILLIVS